MADADGELAAGDAALDVHEAAEVAGGDGVGAAGGDGVQFVGEHLRGDVGVFDGESAAETAALVGIGQFGYGEAGDGSKQMEGGILDAEFAEEVAGGMVGYGGGRMAGWGVVGVGIGIGIAIASGINMDIGIGISVGIGNGISVNIGIRIGIGNAVGRNDLGQEFGVFRDAGGEGLGFGEQVRVVGEKVKVKDAQHCAAGAGGDDDGDIVSIIAIAGAVAIAIGIGKGVQDADGELAGLSGVAGVVEGLAAAGLAGGEGDADAVAAQRPHDADADLGVQLVDDAGGEQGNPLGGWGGGQVGGYLRAMCDMRDKVSRGGRFGQGGV